MLKAFTIALAALVLVGCGPPIPEADYWIDGVGIKVEEGAMAWTQAPDFRDRVRLIGEVSMTYGGKSWDDLRGWVIVFRAKKATIKCSDTGGNPDNTKGCAHFSGWMEIDTYSASVESSALAHEVLHAALTQDRCHSDPRWGDFQPVVDALVAAGALDGQTYPLHLWRLLWARHPTC